MASESSTSATSKGKQPLRRRSFTPDSPPRKRVRSHSPTDHSVDVELELQSAVDAATARSTTPHVSAYDSVEDDDQWSLDEGQRTPSVDNEEVDLEDRAVRYSEIVRNLKTAITSAKGNADRESRLRQSLRQVEGVYDRYQTQKRDGQLPEQLAAQSRGIHIREYIAQLSSACAQGRACSPPPSIPSAPERTQSLPQPRTVQALMAGTAFARYANGEYYFKAMGPASVPHPPTTFCNGELKSDGRFGLVDPLHWPQLFSGTQPHWAITPRRPRPDHPAAILWSLPTLDDIEDTTHTTSAEALVISRPAVRERLHAAVDSLRPFSEKHDDHLRRLIASMEEYLDRHRGLPDNECQIRLEERRQERARFTQMHSELMYALSLFAAPSSFRHLKLQWAYLHRCWVQSWTYMEFAKLQTPPISGNVNPVHLGLDGSGVMGAFTANREQALRLCGLGIPVWEIGPMHYASEGWQWQSFEEPVGIPQDRGDMPDGWKISVRSGGLQFQAIAESARRLAGQSVVVWTPQQPLPPPQRYTAEIHAQPGASGSAGRKVTNSNQFEEKLHNLLPPRVSVWQHALGTIDTQSSRAASPLGLWLPDSEFLITPQKPSRVFFYVGIWLHHRVHLQQKLLSEDARYTPLKTSTWRCLFDRQPALPGQPPAQPPAKNTKKFKDKLAALKTLSDLLGQEVRPRAEDITSYVWHGHKMTQADFLGSSYLAHTVGPLREIAWELGEMGFRADLQAIDAHLLPKMSGALGNAGGITVIERRVLIAEIAQDGHAVVPAVPPNSHAGLWATDITHRAPSLEAFRKLLVRWPRTPQWLSLAPPLSRETPAAQLLEFEGKIAWYYCQRFFDEFGRAPTVPRTVPLSVLV